MLRFLPDAAESFRRAIEEAGRVEVFGIGDVVDGQVAEVTITCRGQHDRVTALVDRPRPGQVVIHNHPSGDLTASDADMQLAGLYGEDGVGMVIVDNAVARDQWVVEPHVKKRVDVPFSAVEAVFLESLPKRIPGWEHRPEQLVMAADVLKCLNENSPVLVEAGTGTGKSLAYLVPAALWARANEARVVVSTYTKTLQAQLWNADLPMLRKGGIDVEAALLQGRNNYVCKRRLGLALADPDDEPTIRRLADWESRSPDGSRTDLPFPIDEEVWDQVESDSDLTLSTRCPHYAECRYYAARRQAAAARLVVVNHALLLADRAIAQFAGRGILPRFDRLILDEGHHLEDAATSAASERLTATAIRRAASLVLPGKKRRGALDKLADGGDDARLGRIASAEVAVAAVRDSARWLLTEVRERALGADPTPRRVDPTWRQGPAWESDVSGLVELENQLAAAAAALTAVEDALEGTTLPPERVQPRLDVRQARRRLGAHSVLLKRFLDGPTGPTDSECRWVEPVRERGAAPSAAVVVSPVEVGGVLQKLLWTPLPGATVTSATLTVAGRFGFLRSRIGLDESAERSLASPFDHARQALLGLPKDLPSPNDPGFLEASAEVVRDAVRLSRGAAFVLCTSYAAVDHYAMALRKAGVPSVLAQGERGRATLLERFLDTSGVLVGTDTFWEGVSVSGDRLVLVVIPRLPFRVPSDPLRMARAEALKTRGLDPFRAHALPEAALKLKQGYGRLIRTKTDRGVVLLLDRRVHEARYGPILLRSLPPARRVVGPWQRVREEVASFYTGLSDLGA